MTFHFYCANLLHSKGHGPITVAFGQDLITDWSPLGKRWSLEKVCIPHLVGEWLLALVGRLP